MLETFVAKTQIFECLRLVFEAFNCEIVHGRFEKLLPSEVVAGEHTSRENNIAKVLAKRIEVERDLCRHFCRCTVYFHI